MTKQIRIAIDLDGVLTEHPAPLAREANAQFGLELPESAFIDSAGHKVDDDVRFWVYADDGPASRLLTSPRASAFLRDLVESFGADNVLILTARPSASTEMTASWLKQNQLDLCKVVYADDKVAAAREHGVTHAIEDSTRHAVAYSAAGITTFLLGANEVEANGNIIPVTSLDEITEHLRSLNGSPSPPTGRPRIVVSDVIDPTAHAALETGGEVIDVDGTDVDALFEAVRDADALVIRSETQVTRDLIEHARKLRLIARAGVGVDNIDLDAATGAGILVLNAPGANRFSAGEHTIALMLALARQIPQANASMHAGKWERKRFKIFDLHGKTVGIVGLGRVGRVVARRLAAFGCHVIAHDPYVSADIFRELGVERVSYPELLATSDIVSYHVPLTDETEHYLSRDAVKQLKPGAVVINAARGEVVDQDALAEALDSGKVRAAAIDVFPVEPLTGSPLIGRDNVLLTPHIGGSSAEAQAAVGEMISTSVLAALRGEAVPNAVNLPAAEIEAEASRRIGLAAAAAGHLLSVLEPQAPKSFSMQARGNLSDEVTELVFTAALSAALQGWLPGRITPVNARMHAREAGIEQHISRFGVPDGSGAVDFEFEVQNDESHHVTVRWSGNDIGIYEVDRFSLGHPLAGDVLITHHRDVPGVVGKVGTILGQHGVNIAGMQLGRHDRGGEALMVLNVDSAIPEAALTEIKSALNIDNAYVVSLPGAG